MPTYLQVIPTGLKSNLSVLLEPLALTGRMRTIHNHQMSFYIDSPDIEFTKPNNVTLKSLPTEPDLAAEGMFKVSNELKGNMSFSIGLCMAGKMGQKAEIIRRTDAFILELDKTITLFLFDIQEESRPALPQRGGHEYASIPRASGQINIELTLLNL